MRNVFKKLLDIHGIVLANINEENAEELLELCRSFEDKLNKIFEQKKPQLQIEQPWKLLIGKSEEEIRKFLDDKYDTAMDLAEAFKSFLPPRVRSDVKRGKIKRKRTVINHIIKEFKKMEGFKV